MNLPHVFRLCFASSLIFVFFACSENEDQDYGHCSESLSACQGFQDGSYCLFGLKWGEDPVFEKSGIDVIGPQSAGGIITFSFLTETRLVSSSKTRNMETVPFDNKGACARDEARAALKAWETYGNFEFKEVDDNSASDIQFIAANGVVEALGNPNYKDATCEGLGGNIFFSGSQIPCQLIFTLCLHEIGHVLGLGHVSESTIMGTGISKGLDSLHQGDIDGIQAIYGAK